ncbi:zinc-dependent metalloprotease [Phenylobacterium sp.]|uniref:zinc-dependent metalloprotease n=1 Tax=Phenylobacterium sp. TaxID=1871053 RepID=UPI002726D39D|nr:zinc-dependent metalloprotease [Phenylobacterium sp.]MDO8380090.1 zinc-dependent metalloprotease [Phenylobacterium sp.]
MTRSIWLCSGAAALVLLTGAPASARDKAPAATAGAQRQEGLLPVYVDKTRGTILLSLPAPDADGVSGRFLYLTALRTGMGSAPVGLDRAAIGDTQVLVFRRLGKKVFAEYENPRFRAAGAPAPEQTAAREAFATSTVWAGEVVGTEGDGRILVDISSFLTRDVMGAADALKRADEKGYRLVPELSAADPSMVKVFPENLEFEARQTYQSDTPGPESRNIAPDAKLITLQVRHSLVKLPTPGYEVRRFDPRAGVFGSTVLDYAAPLGADIVGQVAHRFRLEKTDPAAAKSPVKRPIVFYVDRAAPEPIRTALKEGAAWWAQAFEAAGYQDAYRVEILPEGVDPLDVRYNVINWVDRATRGWSVGQSVRDPRTGEILKGSVLLGALRVRQDMLIFEGLAGADKVGTGGPNDPVEVSLARLRQLAAHEVGHSLGFAHNFAGSTQDRASVMDYPAPRVTLVAGKPDLSDAYGVGLGAWDKFIVDWLYGQVPAGAAGEAALAAKARAEMASGARYVTDGDSRPAGAAQPWGALWDDGADPIAELTRMMGVRRAALDRFGLSALRTGEPVANLRRKYVPIFLLHRYQVDAVAKQLAGIDYPYAVKGDAREAAAIVPATQQRAALEALLATLKPAELDTPDALIPLLSAGRSGDNDRQFEIEVFDGDPVFDPLTAADVAAGLTLEALTAADRLGRLVEQRRRDATLPGAGEVLDRLIATAFAPASGRSVEIARRTQTRTVLDLAAVSRNAETSPAVSAEIDQRLADLAARLKAAPGEGADRAHRLRLAGLIGDREEMARVLAQPKLKPTVPPGMPIGDDGDW